MEFHFQLKEWRRFFSWKMNVDHCLWMGRQHIIQYSDPKSSLFILRIVHWLSEKTNEFISVFVSLYRQIISLLDRRMWISVGFLAISTISFVSFTFLESSLRKLLCLICIIYHAGIFMQHIIMRAGTHGICHVTSFFSFLLLRLIEWPLARLDGCTYQTRHFNKKAQNAVVFIRIYKVLTMLWYTQLLSCFS